MEYYSAMRKDILLLKMTRMGLYSIALSGVKSDRQRVGYDITYMWSLKKTNLETERRVVVTRGTGVGELGRYWSECTNLLEKNIFLSISKNDKSV